MDKLFETKSINAEVKDVDTKNRVITGYLSNFGNKDYDNDVIEKGAFKKSLSERKGNIWFLNQHQWSQPHGKFALLQEDSKGLYFESMPLIDTTYSSDTLKLYEAGIMKEHSIGFSTVKDAIEKGVRYIKEVKLYEGSNVTMGANPNTPFTGFKSLTPQEANDQVNRIVKMLRNGTLTDETFEILEIALKQLQKDMYELGKKSLNEPHDSTQDKEPNTKELADMIRGFKF
jgi:hypothetical protein